MTTKAAFYILNDTLPKARALYTCRIIEKAYNNNRTVYIHTPSEAETQNFDVQLWTFSDTSFVPHEIYSPDTDQNIPVLIGHDTPPNKHHDILVNFTPEILPFYQEFNHLIEVILNDETLKTLARKRFQIYQQQGYQTEVFNI